MEECSKKKTSRRMEDPVVEGHQAYDRPVHACDGWSCFGWSEMSHGAESLKSNEDNENNCSESSFSTDAEIPWPIQ